jgi:hypothetical protein
MSEKITNRIFYDTEEQYGSKKVWIPVAQQDSDKVMSDGRPITTVHCLPVSLSEDMVKHLQELGCELIEDNE